MHQKRAANFCFITKRLVAWVFSILIVQSAVFSSLVSAAMLSTETIVEQNQLQYDQQSLQRALNEEGVRDQLLEMGVDADLVEQRIASLTPTELSQLNQEIADLPAGEGVAGVLVAIFVLFVITDMLCATDLFSFVKCINK